MGITSSWTRIPAGRARPLSILLHLRGLAPPASTRCSARLRSTACACACCSIWFCAIAPWVDGARGYRCATHSALPLTQPVFGCLLPLRYLRHAPHPLQPVGGSASDPLITRLFLVDAASTTEGTCSGQTTTNAGFPNGMLVFGVGTDLTFTSHVSCSYNVAQSVPQAVRQLWVKLGTLMSTCARVPSDWLFQGRGPSVGSDC
jgi:hypothetical protein